ncbi:uncharacterized protein LOC128988678 isoform X2 [Macrosteles quadrilineatus]|uniref:uncharacterized protein LOC128988678 isoform X2 n=1 Tax=Macrosteles quadrilineatus TaxID=74068 RepID=UPI0023E2A8D2|nr:uncharacterized protein LOC128988678 isoform X2 [Macrosteles quadrilineatus]
MSTGWRAEHLQEEKILQEEAKSRLIQEKESPAIDENTGAIPLKTIKKENENEPAVGETCLDSPVEEKNLREMVQNQTNVPQVHKTDTKKNKSKLVKQQTLSDLPEDSGEKLVEKVLRKQNTVSGALCSEGKFSPCSLSTDGDRLFIRVRTPSGVDLVTKCLDKTSTTSSEETIQRGNGGLRKGSDIGSRSSGVGTSLVSLSGVGTSSAEGTTERPASIPSVRQRMSGTDFWSQVAQQVAYIDSTGNSNRNSLLLNCGHQIPIPPGSLPLAPTTTPCHTLTGSSGSVDYSTQTDSPPSLTPSPLHPRQHHRFSFRDQPRRGKLSRFYSQDPEPVTRGLGGELRVLQPLLQGPEPLTYSPPLSAGRNSLATVWGGAQELSNRRIRPGTSRFQSTYGRKRKPSSWEESVSLQRRRSIASREETREWRERVLTHHPPEAPTPDPTTPLDKKDLRYYFQHPYLRLFATYFTIFCNFLLFAEDPISHSHAESRIPMVGNVFSFVLTKYPPDWRWSLIKVLMWLTAILCGLVFGKLIVHNILCGKILRLKMFRDEQGSWIAMFLTVIVSLYLFSHVYNLLMIVFYDKPSYYIDSRMGITYASVMKTAACGTWLGDLITALMVTDVMLQDNLYPDWAPMLRRLWRRSNIPRILIFWVGSVLATIIVVTLIISDFISWDKLNRDFIASTELSRAFLASFILVMDLLIMMQDWDFPHFTTTLHINLPGFSVATLEWKYAEIHLTGKWFNYGLIFMVMLLDLNMWKNQIFYYPSKYGQYYEPGRKILTVLDDNILASGNKSLWTWEARSQTNASTGQPYWKNDMVMNSRYMEYPMLLKCTAIIPSFVAVTFFVAVVSLYGRFPEDQEHPNHRSHSPCLADAGVNV